MTIDITKLIGGPYPAPEVAAGDWLHDERWGLVEVGGWTDAPIPWPRLKKTGTHSPILTGALIDAVRRESEAAVAYNWGVSPTTVWAWRKALEVGRITEGTRVLYQEYKPEKLPPEVVARGHVTIAMRTEDKPEQPSRSVSMQMQWADGRRQHVGAWSNEDILAMLKMHVAGRKDREIAKALGRSLHAVRNKRVEALGGNYSPQSGANPKGGMLPHSLDWEVYDTLLGIVPDRTLAILIGCAQNTVAERRRKYRKCPVIKSTPKRIDWGKWDPLLGTMLDKILAAKIGTSVSRVAQRRAALGIEPIGRWSNGKKHSK